MSLVSPNRGYALVTLEGSTGSMAYWNGLFTRVAGYLDDLRTAAQNATALPGVGASITAARADAEELVAALAPDIAEAELLAAVLQQYADAFSASAESANRLVDDIETAHAAWQVLDAEAELAGLRALSSSRLETDTAAADNDAAQDAIADRDRSRSALDALWVEWESHYDQWDAAYDAALAQLSAGAGPAMTSSARDFLDDLLAANGPADVLRIWLEHPQLQAELIAAHPEIVGNLDGIPYSTRHKANMDYLEEVHASPLDEPLRSEIDALWNEVVRKDGVLIAFDPYGSGQLTAAVAYGDIENATDVSVLISGMNSGVKDLPAWAASARELNAAVHAAAGDHTSATIVWFGYDTPTVPEEPWMDRAEDGAAALRSFLLGLDLGAPDAQKTVIAHSYGSTTAAEAIGSDPGGLGVDNLIVVGSAGFPDDPAVLENLQTGPKIFATLSEGDLWARIGRDTSSGHGTVPETLPGTVEFGSDGGYARTDDGSLATDDAHGDPLAATPGHGSHVGGNAFPWEDDDNGYLSNGTESFYNIQQIIITGEPGTTMDGAGSGSGFWDVPDWLPFVNPYRL